MGKLGKLDQRVTFQSNARVSDGMGGQEDGFANFTTNPTVWAKILPLAGGEKNEGGGVAASGRYLITIRNRSDINENDLMIWGGESYNIRNVRRAGTRAMYLKFEVERGVAS